MLDRLYARAAGARRRWFERHPEARHRLSQPVISIGNLSVGGTGKTPLVAEVVRWLLSQGERPAILSRGYRRRRRSRGVTIVSDGTTVLADVTTAGDEPLMLARALTGAVVCVCADRSAAGRFAEEHLHATVHVLDDGFQHLRLARDLDILVTGPGEIPQGRTLPFGRLREAADAAARAHVVVVVGADEAGARSEAWHLGISQSVGARRTLGAERPLERAVFRPPDPTESIYAIAGIGQPTQFFEMLREAGYQVAETRAFADHHWYEQADLVAIEQAMRACGASRVVATEKDAVRLEIFDTLPFALSIVPLRLVLDDWSVLSASIVEAVARKRADTSGDAHHRRAAVEDDQC